MAEETGSADPSMEEILASIRKIISDDVPVAPPVPVGEPPAPSASPSVREDDILELTQMVEEDGSVVDLSETPVVEDIVPVAAITPVVMPPPPPPPPARPLPPAETLVSEPAASSAASALSSLATTVEIERLSASPIGATYLGNGTRTLEDMVVELMRPLLKDWLDKNLTPIVERLVQKEIERISRRT